VVEEAVVVAKTGLIKQLLLTVVELVAIVQWLELMALLTLAVVVVGLQIMFAQVTEEVGL
jgi:hypothetical protein